MTEPGRVNTPVNSPANTRATTGPQPARPQTPDVSSIARSARAMVEQAQENTRLALGSRVEVQLKSVLKSGDLEVRLRTLGEGTQRGQWSQNMRVGVTDTLRPALLDALRTLATGQARQGSVLKAEVVALTPRVTLRLINPDTANAPGTKAWFDAQLRTHLPGAQRLTTTLGNWARALRDSGIGSHQPGRTEAAKPPMQPGQTVTTKPLVQPGQTVATKPLVQPGQTEATKPLVQPGQTAATKPLVQPGQTAATKPLVQPGQTVATKPLVQPGQTEATKPLVQPGQTAATKPLEQPGRAAIAQHQELNQAVKEVLSRLASPQELTDSARLPDTLRNSGVWLEAMLAQGAAAPNQRLPLETDLKGQLLRLAQQLRSGTTPGAERGQPNPGPQAQTKPGGQPTPQRMPDAQMAGADRLVQLTTTLSREVDGMLKQLVTLQLNNADNAPDQPRWTVELPFQTSAGLLALDADIQRESAHDDDSEHWSMQLRLDLPVLGPLLISLTLNNNRLHASLVAEQAAGAERLRERLPELRAQLENRDIEVASLNAREGSTERKAKPRPPLVNEQA